MFEQVSEFCKEQPVVAAAICAGVAAIGYVGFKVGIVTRHA
jgi:hypothetical protein